MAKGTKNIQKEQDFYRYTFLIQRKSSDEKEIIKSGIKKNNVDGNGLINKIKHSNEINHKIKK